MLQARRRAFARAEQARAVRRLAYHAGGAAEDQRVAETARRVQGGVGGGVVGKRQARQAVERAAAAQHRLYAGHHAVEMAGNNRHAAVAAQKDTAVRRKASGGEPA